jgi:Insertion element 4 transposase N-terminal/Transposase DDE domain
VDQSVISRAVTVAGGPFAPGHLGELTQQVPFEMVDAVLGETCRVQRRVRVLPSRVVVCLLLAGCLFAELGYVQVWHRLAAGLGGLPVTVPAASAMTQARRRLGPAPLRELFFLLRGPGPAGARWRGLLVCAVDGTIMTVPDSEANLAVYSKQRGGVNGEAGYPTLRLLALVSCGTRAVIDAVSGPVPAGELSYAAGLLGSLHAGMVLLADRNFGAGLLAAQVAETRADFLIRVRTGKSAPGLPVLSRCPDGSWLSRFGGIPVRVIDAQVTVTTSAGNAASRCRLVTTLLDPARYPAGDLAVLCHERWEAETAYFELKSTILDGRVLRARTPGGIEQEVYALLVTYQVLAVDMFWDIEIWNGTTWRKRLVIGERKNTLSGLQYSPRRRHCPPDQPSRLQERAGKPGSPGAELVHSQAKLDRQRKAIRATERGITELSEKLKKAGS